MWTYAKNGKIRNSIIKGRNKGKRLSYASDLVQGADLIRERSKR
jgi:hypothetical protein